ncbi:MarR family winged helix-turn-helix transcriptional regulator [Myxococcota bacterium]
MTIQDLTDCHYYLITRASLTVTAALKRGLAAAGARNVRPGYLGVLMALWQEDGLKAGELGRRAGLDPSTMTGLLDRMERDVLVERRADPHDRRAQRIFLTDSGHDIEGPVNNVVDETIAAAFEGVDARDLDRLKIALRKVLANARNMGQP